MEISITTTVFLGLAALILEGIGLYVVIVGRVDKRFDQYVRKETQGEINSRLSADISEIKLSIREISQEVRGLITDVPGIIQRVIREEMR